MTDRLVRRQLSDGSKDLYTYTEDGRMKRVERWAVPSGGNSAVRIHWREFGHDIRTGQTANVSSPEGTISYGYHLDGSLASIKTSAGYEATYTYDVRGNISTVSGKSVGGTVNYTYNTITGRKTQVARPNGVATVYAYDTRGFLQSITDAKGSTPVLTQSYTRDKRGQVLTLSETHQGEAATVWTYGYDSLKRLSTAVATGQNPASYSYTYDKAGNRLSKNYSGVLTNYSYNSLDQLVWEHTAGDGQKSYEFDIYGNLTVEKLAGVTKRTYSWDGENRMTKAVLSENGKTYEFLYDADGARVKREVSNGSSQVVKTNYLSDYVNPSGYTQSLQETDEAGEGRAYVWSGEGLLAQSGIAPESAEETRFSHTDHLGTVKALTGAAGATVAGSAFKYSPFGEKTAGTNSMTSYHFTGQYAEDELGLQYHRARWLSPAKAGWMSQDPVYDFPANFGNGYGYAGQNPVNKLDLNGQFSLSGMGGASGIVSSLGSFSLTIAQGILAHVTKHFFAYFTTVIATAAFIHVMGYFNVKNMENKILSDWRSYYEESGHRWNLPPEVIAAIHLNELRDLSKNIIGPRSYDVLALSRFVAFDSRFGTTVIPSQLTRSYLDTHYLNERRNGVSSANYAGTAYQPLGTILPESNDSSEILREMKWNIDFSAQHIRRFCSEIESVHHSSAGSPIKNKGIEFIRKPGSEWPMGNKDERHNLIIAIQSRYQGDWDDRSFLNPAQALEDVRNAWGIK